VRRRPAGAGYDGSVCQDPHRLWQADRQLPTGQASGRRHAGQDREREVVETYYAAWAVDQGLDEAPLGVSMAKAAASDMVRKVAGTGVQPHGGIGMTWKHDLQLYFKRAKASEVAVGDAGWHRERVVQLMAPA